MISTALKRAEQLYDYMVENSIRETDVVTRQRAETESLPTPLHISQEQAQFFAFLIPAIGARKALEVCTFTGTSALAVTAALPPDGKLIGCESRMAVMSAAWFVEFRQRLPWLVHVD